MNKYHSPCMNPHCFLPQSFSTGVKQTDLLQNTVWTQVLWNCFRQQNKITQPESTHATTCPTVTFPGTTSLAVLRDVTHWSSSLCSCEQPDKAMKNPNWGSSCLSTDQPLLQHSFTTNIALCCFIVEITYAYRTNIYIVSFFLWKGEQYQTDEPTNEIVKPGAMKSNPAF